MKNYLLKIKNFLKYGFIDDGNTLLGASKLGENQGKNDGDLCVLAYNLPKSSCLVKKKEGK